jgi:hypothetical protein
MKNKDTFTLWGVQDIDSGQVFVARQSREQARKSNDQGEAQPCYAVFVRKAGNWIQESVPFDSYASAQAHAKLTRRARPFVEMTRVRRLSHNWNYADAP